MKATKLIILMMALSLMGFGCSQYNSQAKPAGAAAAPAVDIRGALPGAPELGGGATPVGGSNSVEFRPDSLQVMSEYVATRPLNNPTNYRISLNLSQAEAARYGGEISISYLDNGIPYNGVFRAGMGRNQSVKGMYDNNALEAQYNYWFEFGGKKVFSGFFEDQFGAIAIVLEPENLGSLGNDAEPFSTTYKGAVYFKNFKATPAPHSAIRACWFTYMGPYDCRSNVVMTKCGLNPGVDTGYKRLGTFTGLSVKQAFNIQ